jgi:hypothetical protein
MNTYDTNSTVRGGQIRVLGMDIDFAFSMERKVLFDNSQVRKYLDETGSADWITTEEELINELIDMVYADLHKSYVKQLEDKLAEYNMSSISETAEIEKLQKKAAGITDNPLAAKLIDELIEEKRKGEMLRNELLRGWPVSATGY